MRDIQRRSLLVAASAAAASPWAWAQPAYPSAKPIRYIVPVAAGGGADMIARATCDRMAKVLGQSMVVENVSGGSGVIASQNTVRAQPDGYTLMQVYVATHGTAPATRKLPFDPIRDFTAIGMIGTAPNVLCVNPAVPAQDVKSFIAYVKSRPGKLSYGSAGAGTLTHLVGELFKLQTGTFMTHIPYRGVAPSNVDLIAGQTQASFPSLAGVAGHIRAGRMRPLAVTGAKRHPLLPDVPTFAEAGLTGFDGEQWYGIMGPAGLPPGVVKTLGDALSTVLAQQDFQEKLSAEAVALRPMSADAFVAYIRADIDRWTRVARERKLDLES